MAKGGPKSLRGRGKRVRVPNSGREVWVYDDANRDTIRTVGPPETGAGGMPPAFEQSARGGLVLGYSLLQDDEVDVEVHVGAPFTPAELARGRWLEPQHAFLRVPSGRLCVESNDASRIGPEAPTEKGKTVTVPKGEYRVTLLRVDHEALDREGLAWQGAEEMLLLTPGGTAADAVAELLPFEERRDLGWVGRYTLRDRSADALAWFGDAADTFHLNLDSAAAAKRDTTSVRVKDEHLNVWLPASVEILDGAPSPARAAELAMTRTNLATKALFDDAFLTMVPGEVLPGVDDLKSLPLPAALKRIDAKLAKMALAAQGDVDWVHEAGAERVELGLRFYLGPADAIAVVVVGPGSFEIVFVSEREDGTWVVTGFADELARRFTLKDERGIPRPHPRITFATMDETLAKIRTALAKAIKGTKLKAAPTDGEAAGAAFTRLMETALLSDPPRPT